MSYYSLGYGKTPGIDGLGTGGPTGGSGMGSEGTPGISVGIIGTVGTIVGTGMLTVGREGSGSESR
jgi:hypothetical protein